MENTKIYVGSGKEKKFDGGGSIITVTLDLDTILREYESHGFLSNQSARKIKIDISTRRSVGEYGDTHSVSVNTWHPDSYNPPAASKSPTIGETEEIPF